MSDDVVVDELPVSILLGGEVHRTTPDATLVEIASILTKYDVGALVIDDGDDEAVAIISERDVVRALADHRNAANVKAHQIASDRLRWCNEEDTIGTVAAQMVENYIRHMLVERDGDLVGVVSLRDVLGAYTSYRSAELESD